MRLPRLFTTLWGGLALLAALSAPVPAIAVTPEEMLADPALEERARTLSKQLRCLVCQNQSIDDSDADLARDLRVEVRRQLSTGSSDAKILANLRETYGDYVLLNPPVSPGTYVLWGSPVFILLAGAAIIIAGRRRREDADGTAALDPAEPPAPPLPPGTGRTAIALGSLVLAVSLGLYLVLGRADLPSQPLAGRGAELAAAADASNAQMAEKQTGLDEARSAAATSPDDVGAWLRLAMAAAAAGETNTELAALEQAERLTNGDPAIRAMQAEAMSRAADGQVTIPARELITRILAEDPSEPRALFLSGLAAYQDENFGAAVEIWLRLQSLSAPDAPWMALLADNIADAAKAGGINLDAVTPARGPDAETMAAAAEMSDEDRAAMIEGMVEGLAARLAEEPGDAAGWQRLARAYDVLGRPEDATRAMIGRADAMPGDAGAQLAALEGVVVNRLEEGLAEDAGRLLERIASLAPDRSETLYIRGHFAKLSGDVEAARALWQALLDRLPDDAPIVGQLRDAIDAL